MLSDEPFLLSKLPPSPEQKRLAIGVVLALLLASAITTPFARIQLTDTEALLPAYAAAVLVNELITSVLLLALFSVQRSRAVLALAIGYLFSGLMVVPWSLSFPGVLPATDLDTGVQSTASVAALRRIGFPLLVVIYALLKDQPTVAMKSQRSMRQTVLVSVAGVVFVVGSVLWLIFVNHEVLPKLMADKNIASGLWWYVAWASMILYVAGMLLLWRRRCSVLDLWLIVVLCTLLIEIVLLSFISAGIRLNVGWWAGRLFGLISTSLVLIVLLFETTALYGRLARSVLAERRTREDRLTAMEALSASVAHEISQPLASMVTNADAGLRWMNKANPDLEEATAALKRIVRDGHRAGGVVEGIRTMFRKGAQERAPVNINQIIGQALSHAQTEVQLAHVSVRLDLDERLPTVIGSPVQLRQVVANLVSNAVDAMQAVIGRARILHISSGQDEPSRIFVSVADSGTGVDSLPLDRIFEPFFSTKAEGMGMGLMFCRSIVEAHGGQLRVTENHPHGANFLFTLPTSDVRTSPGSTA